MLRRLANELGGSLHVRNRADGARGVHFELSIPLRVLLVSSDAPLAAPARVGVSSATSGSGSVVRVEPTVVYFPVRATVLVVDDSDANRRLLRRYLQQLGCTVLVASDGDEVLGALEANIASSDLPVDVVLMDISMERMDGRAALRAMRDAGWTLPVVATTGDGGAREAAECEQRAAPPLWKCAWRVSYAASAADLSHGFAGVLAKPFSREMLRDALLANRVVRRNVKSPPAQTAGVLSSSPALAARTLGV